MNTNANAGNAMARKPTTKAARLVIHADGGSRGNPGPSAIGVVIEDAGGNVIERFGRRIADGTNNEAEYKAAIIAAERAIALGAVDAEFLFDSELLVFQVTRQYRVKSRRLAGLHALLMEKLARIPKWAVRHVPRQLNAEADALLNQALDQPD